LYHLPRNRVARICGFREQGDGTLTAVARTGTEMSGIGTIRGLHRADIVANERRDLAFWAQLTDGREVLILAAPRR
jgi:hypothetical protein